MLYIIVGLCIKSICHKPCRHRRFTRGDTGVQASGFKTRFKKFLRKIIWFTNLRATIVAYGLRRVINNIFNIGEVSVVCF